jgi:hypothetical protein
MTTTVQQPTNNVQGEVDVYVPPCGSIKPVSPSPTSHSKLSTNTTRMSTSASKWTNFPAMTPATKSAFLVTLPLPPTTKPALWGLAPTRMRRSISTLIALCGLPLEITLLPSKDISTRAVEPIHSGTLRRRRSSRRRRVMLFLRALWIIMAVRVLFPPLSYQTLTVYRLYVHEASACE